MVTQKVVSKAEGRLVAIDPNDPLSHKALVHEEAVRILRRRGELLMTETRHGFVCANAGVDLSNVERGWAALLPLDADRSARRIRDGLRARAGVEVGVIVSDTFGRTWRRGVTDVAIGSAGVACVVDLRGTTDALGRELQVTEVCVADELAAAAELVMGKASASRWPWFEAWTRPGCGKGRSGRRSYGRTTRIFSAEVASGPLIAGTSPGRPPSLRPVTSMASIPDGWPPGPGPG